MTIPARNRDIEATTLDNGVRVITESMNHVRSVAAGIWIGTGARRETPEQNGISHFIEHMVFQGTENRSAEDIAREVDSLGGHLDAYTAKELVSFNTKVLDEHLPIAFDILSDLVLRPVFRDADIAKEKGVILEEIKMESDSPEYVVHELFCQQFWGDNGLGRPIIGTPETVGAFDRNSVEDYFRSAYSPSNIVITAAGNLRHEQVLEMVQRDFGGLPASAAAPVDVRPEPRPHLQLQNKDALEQVHLSLGVPTVPVNHETRYAWYALNTMLGGGMSSRLFQNIREKRGLAYSVFSELNLYRDTGCLLVNAGTSLDSAREVVRLTLKELRRLKDETTPAEELRRTKDQLKGSLMLGLESTGARMANLARQYLYFGRFFNLDEILEGIESVTADDVQALATEYFQSDKLALTVLGSLDGLEIRPTELVC